MDGIFLDPVTACNQSYNVTEAAADVVDVRRGESILDVSSDIPLLSEIDDLDMIGVVRFQVVLGPRGGPVQFILQGRRHLYTYEQPFTDHDHLTSPLLIHHHAENILARKNMRHRTTESRKFDRDI
jgi:hypothetical protein